MVTLHKQLFKTDIRTKVLRQYSVYPNHNNMVDVHVMPEHGDDYDVNGVTWEEYNFSVLVRPYLLGKEPEEVEIYLNKLQLLLNVAYEKGVEDTTEHDESL